MVAVEQELTGLPTPARENATLKKGEKTRKEKKERGE